jgi:hypothetical protein
MVEEHSPVHNLISLQAMAALKQLDVQIAKDWEEGYGVDVDRLLECRHRLVRQLREGPVA